MMLARMLSCVAVTATLLAQSPNLNWQLEANPPSRTAPALVHHEALGKSVLFGGVEGDYLADTWTWDGAWQRVETAVAPSPRSNVAMAYDSTRDRLVLFGGRNRTSVLGETWVFDGTAWTQLAPPVSPPATHRHRMCYDPVRDRVIVKGGNRTLFGASTDELWEFDGNTWQLMPQGAGAPSTGTSMVYDAARAETLLWTAFDLYAWNGSSWTQRSSAGLPSPSTCQLQYDPVTQRVLVTNPFYNAGLQAGTYAYEGQGWTLIDATPPGSGIFRTMSFDPVEQRWLGFQDAAFNADTQSHTWVLADGAWQRVQVGLPPGRRNAAMAYDRHRRRLVVHGGANGALSRDDLYEADNRTWNRLLGLNGPSIASRRQLLTMVFDEAREETLVFGGTSPLSSSLLAWTSAGWSFGNPTVWPPARWRHAAAYDSLRQRMLVFGGEGSAPAFGDLWSWDGTDWQQLPGGGPGPRRDVSMSYDRDRDRIVLFGGHDGSSYLGDTWEFDGVTWLEQTPTAAPAARGRHVQVYDTHLQRTVLYGGTDGADLRDTWLWDGSNWTELVTATQPDTGIGVCAAYDPDRRELILFGGGSDLFEGSRGEMWRLREVGLGNWESSGAGCSAGAGPLALEALDPCAIGTTARLRLDNTLSSFVALPIAWVGFDSLQWNGVALPVSLAALGSPQCFVWADAQVPIPMLPSGNEAFGDLVLPDEPSIVGLQLFVQGASWNFATSEVATANLLTGTIGVP